MEKKNYGRPQSGNRPRRDGDNRRPRRDGDNRNEERPRRNFHSNDEERPRRNFRSNDEERPRRNFHSNDEERPRRNFRSNDESRPRKNFGGRRRPMNDEQFDRIDGGDFSKYKQNRGRAAKPVNPNPDKEGVRLNKYLANAGICSRRDADKLIQAGSVTVNGKVVSEMGIRVKETDVVSYAGETLRAEKKRYFLLNKPKGYITTADDPQERKTVMMLIDGACPERIYPVGRLDRNTTGLLLFTNDGEMAKKLTHPSTGIYKIYHVELDKAVTREHMKQMLEGFELEDGPIKVDDVQYAGNGDDKRIVGVAIHSGRNRIVRRIFESMGYDVHKLDRVVFAGLTKKDLPRGRYRELTEQEVCFLKML